MRGSAYYIGFYNNDKKYIYLSFIAYVDLCNKCSLLKLSLVTIFFHFTKHILEGSVHKSMVSADGSSMKPGQVGRRRF